MPPRTFNEVLASEVARMQALAPEKEGQIGRACALIMQGYVQPRADGFKVLSSDGKTFYDVNGSCSCRAGEHGQRCKHQDATALYEYVQRKMAAQTVPEPPPPAGALPEAPSSANVRVLVGAHEVQFTVRGTSDAEVLTRLQALLKRPEIRPLPPKPAPRAGGQWKRGNQGR